MQEKFEEFGEALSKGTSAEQIQAAENTLLELAKILSKLHLQVLHVWI